MAYLDTLKEIETVVDRTSDFNIAQRAVMLDLIEREINQIGLSEDPFIRFFENCTSNKIEFDFKSHMGAGSYNSAASEASACLTIFADFKSMQPNSSVLSWLICALKYTDEIVLHYIQEILNEEAIKHNDYGKERSRYIQINQAGYSAQVAGRIMNNLYDQRNKLEHRTKNDPNTNKQLIIPPNFNKALKKIKQTFPRALVCFRDAYLEYYN